MNRRKFFKSLAIGATAVVVAPKLLASKSKLDGYTVAKPYIGGIKNRNIIIGTDHTRAVEFHKAMQKEALAYTIPGINGGTFWIKFDDWQAQKSWYEIQERKCLSTMI